MNVPLVRRILLPVERFFALEASSGVLLAACTVIALALANSPLAEAYAHLLHTKALGLSIHHWINDGLMTIFFFVVGMEIKRELVQGELSSPRKAVLPMAAALGGMIAPALIYYSFNPSGPAARGWGIPMATDIAFAVGVLSFFGKRIPLSLKVFLLALAIVDDLGAVLVIAFFYTSEISGPYLGCAALLLGAMAVVRRAGMRSYFVYSIFGTLVWFSVLKSGVHATVAGVVIGLLTPIRYPGKSGEYSPLNHLVHVLHPWVSYGIMPLFALANAGVSLQGSVTETFGNSVFIGIVLGLFLGKPIGIIGFCFLAVVTKVGELPKGIGWGDMLGVAALAGIGFTMALFISSLALYPEQEAFSKSAILFGSTLSALAGAGLLFIFTRNNPVE